MNEQLWLGWNVVKQAIEQGHPLDREMNALMRGVWDVPGRKDAVSGAMACLIKVVLELRRVGNTMRVFRDQSADAAAAVEFLDYSEARIRSDVSLALETKDGRALVFQASALATVVTAYRTWVTFTDPEPRVELSEQVSDSKPGERWTGYAIQTVERDGNDEITSTRTDYYGGRP